MTNLNIGTVLSTKVCKVHIVKAVFSRSHVPMREAIKKAEHQRHDDFILWCWRRLLRVSKEITPVNHEEITHNILEGTDAEAEAPINWPPDVKR